LVFGGQGSFPPRLEGKRFKNTRKTGVIGRNQGKAGREAGRKREKTQIRYKKGD